MIESEFKDVQTSALALESAGLVEFTLRAPGVEVKLSMTPRDAYGVAEQLETAAAEVEDA